MAAQTKLGEALLPAVSLAGVFAALQSFCVLWDKSCRLGLVRRCLDLPPS